MFKWVRKKKCKCPVTSLVLRSEHLAVCSVCGREFDKNSMDVVGKDWFDFLFKGKDVQSG